MTTENILIALLLSTLLVSVAVLAVCIKALQGKLEIRMLPSEEIQAMIRFIKSNPGYAQLLNPKQVQEAEAAAKKAFDQYNSTGEEMGGQRHDR